MERQIRKIKTPLGKEIELKDYLTARERNELRTVYLSNMKVGTENDEPVIKEIPGSIVDQAEKKLIELAVVSYDGSRENILDRLLDGLPEEYDFVIEEANRIGKGNFQKAK